jgi:hypothetical protein
MVPSQKHAQAHTALQVLGPLIASLNSPQLFLPISSLCPEIKITRKERFKMADIMSTT